jgi:hypothetical protein
VSSHCNPGGRPVRSTFRRSPSTFHSGLQAIWHLRRLRGLLLRRRFGLERAILRSISPCLNGQGFNSVSLSSPGFQLLSFSMKPLSL